MASLHRKWLKRFLPHPEEGVYVDSRRLRDYYDRGDDLVEEHFSRSLDQDLRATLQRVAPHGDEWSW